MASSGYFNGRGVGSINGHFIPFFSDLLHSVVSLTHKVYTVTLNADRPTFGHVAHGFSLGLTGVNFSAVLPTQS